TTVGLRERKKEKTRLAIFDAALDLFLEQGYESTTVEQIAGAVEISPRTFFRYFTGKDHLVLLFHDQAEELMLEVLAGLPPDEPPFACLMRALRAVLADVRAAAPEHADRFMKLRRLLDEHPRLFGQSVARGAETERHLAEAIAARRGVDPDRDQLTHLIVGFAMSTMRVGFECSRQDGTMEEVQERMAESIALAERSLRPGWDL
ncbi:TetR family transcriptional regulator, partial [Nonomuraea sp. NPDC004297]